MKANMTQSIEAQKNEMAGMLEKARDKVAASKPENTAEPIETTRQPFDVEFFDAANSFCKQILEKVPELQSVIVVPVFRPQPEDSMPGLIRGRDPSEPQISVIIKALRRLIAFSHELDGIMFKHLREYDKYANELLVEIRKRKAELSTLSNDTESEQKDD